MRAGKVTNRDVERMRDLAARDVPYVTIAAEIGCSPATVCRHTRGLPTCGGRKMNRKKGERMVLAAEHVPPGERDGLAERFGYANVKAFNEMLCRYRKRLAATSALEEVVRREAAARGEIAA